jgi:hypothetical protein
MSQKEPLNELGLLAILGTIAFFGFITMFFSKLADNVDAYYHGRSVGVQRALKAIYKSLYSNRGFISRMNDIVSTTGIGPGWITAFINDSYTQRLLKQYKDDPDINYEELELELARTATKAMNDEATERGITSDMSKKMQAMKWKA